MAATGCERSERACAGGASRLIRKHHPGSCLHGARRDELDCTTLHARISARPSLSSSPLPHPAYFCALLSPSRPFLTLPASLRADGRGSWEDRHSGRVRGRACHDVAHRAHGVRGGLLELPARHDQERALGGPAARASPAQRLVTRMHTRPEFLRASAHIVPGKHQRSSRQVRGARAPVLFSVIPPSIALALSDAVWGGPAPGQSPKERLHRVVGPQPVLRGRALHHARHLAAGVGLALTAVAHLAV